MNENDLCNTDTLTMPVKSILKAELVIAKQDIFSKKRVLENIANVVSKRLNCGSKAIYEAVLDREKLGSTGIGNGIAIPHCRLEVANHTVLAVMSLQEAINYDSIDKKKVDLIFALIVPPNECDNHLSTLSAIAKLAQSNQKLSKLRSAKTNKALLNELISLL